MLQRTGQDGQTRNNNLYMCLVSERGWKRCLISSHWGFLRQEWVLTSRLNDSLFPLKWDKKMSVQMCLLLSLVWTPGSWGSCRRVVLCSPGITHLFHSMLSVSRLNRDYSLTLMIFVEANQCRYKGWTTMECNARKKKKKRLHSLYLITFKENSADKWSVCLKKSIQTRFALTNKDKGGCKKPSI